MPTRLIIVAAVALLATCATVRADSVAIRSATNIDIMPDRFEEGMSALRQYMDGAKGDKALTSVQLSQQTGSPNHFILIQTMADESGYKSHVQASYVLKFRQRLQPLLGSPWDERLYSDVP
jgi:quinol monooxygenase YgiN